MAIYIIDDDIFYSTMMENQLENLLPSRVHKFEDWESAMLEAAQVKPEIVFLDLNLKEENTIHHIEDFKLKYPNSFLICMTASDDENTRKECMDKGAFYFLDKNRDLNKNVNEIIIEVNKYNNYFT